MISNYLCYKVILIIIFFYQNMIYNYLYIICKHYGEFFMSVSTMQEYFLYLY